MAKLPWDGPLFPVKAHMAERYAAALKHARGLECTLTEFGVDRMGWSPQIAATLGEDYLGDEALRYAIILSPDQATAPPLRRRFSYEAALIEKVYLEAREALLTLVEGEPVVVEMDNGLTFCRNSVDVLGIQAVVARIDTPRDTLAKTRTLLELSQGLAEKSRLLDESYIDRMLELVKVVGDPRRRQLPPGIRLPNAGRLLGSLWAEVAGPVYVLRSPAQKPGETLVVAARPDEALRQFPVVPLELGDPLVVDIFHQEGLLHYNNVVTLLRKRLGELEIEALLAAGVAPAVDATARRRQFGGAPAAQAALPQLYWELDAEQKRQAAGAPFDPVRLSAEARWALSTPARDAEVVGHLLARFVRYDYRMMALHHRRIIRAEWGRYSEAKRRYLETMFPYMTQGFGDQPETLPANKQSVEASPAAST